MPEFHGEGEEEGIDENNETVKEIGNADGLHQIDLQEGVVAVQRELPYEYCQHDQHVFFVGEGDGDNVTELGGVDDGVIYLAGKREQYHVQQTQEEAEMTDILQKCQLVGRHGGQLVGINGGDQNQNTGQEGGGKLIEGHVVRTHALGQELDVPCGIARNRDDVKDVCKELQHRHADDQRCGIRDQTGQHGQCEDTADVVQRLARG